MVARQRRRRGEGEQLRAELVDSAIALLSEPQVLPTPGLRAIARASGVAPSAVYMHFPSQDALLEAVTEELFGRLRHGLDAVDDPAADPSTRIRRMADGYVSWAAEYPGAYQLLFERPDPTVHTDDAPGLDLLARLAELLREQGVPDADAWGPRVWCVVHGVVSLHMHKPGTPWVTDARADIQTLLDALLPRIGAG